MKEGLNMELAQALTWARIDMEKLYASVQNKISTKPGRKRYD
jgi:hypothetical protein